MKKVVCHISKKEVHLNDAKKADELPDALYSLIAKDHPDFSKDAHISREELNQFRKKYIASIISQEIGELDKLENEVVDAISSNHDSSE